MTVRGGRQYRDPVKARLTLVEDLKPNQWAGVVAVVARNAELGNWTVDETHQVLSMLGVDTSTAREAKAALRRARRLKLIYAAAPTPKKLPKPRTAQPAAKKAPSPPLPPPEPKPFEPGKPLRDTYGHFTVNELCTAGLHPNIPENRITRPDRAQTECKLCTKERKKKYPRKRTEAQRERDNERRRQARREGRP